MPISQKTTADKVAIYVRVSTHWQIDKDSLVVQRRELTAYSELVLGIKDYEIFEDAGYSGKNIERPDYQRMMNRIRTGEFSHLLVWKIDRISRNLLDFANMYEELKRAGITFISKNESFDTSSAIGEAMLKIILIFAELERKMTAERVTAVMLSKANAGDWNGGHVPFGYTYNKDTKEFQINPAEKNLYDKMCELYETYQSLIHVTNTLNDEGYHTRRGKLWSTASVYKILTNIWYIGAYRYNVHQIGSSYRLRDEDEWITIYDHHPPMIDEDRYKRLCFLLQRNRRSSTREGQSYIRKHVHIFAGLLRCGVCGMNMSSSLGKRRANGYRPSIYGCSGRRMKSDCNNKFINDLKIGPFVFNFIGNILRMKGKSVTKMTLDSIEKKLLHGEVFSGISIPPEDLPKVVGMLTSGSSGMEFRPPNVFSSSLDSATEQFSLEERIHKNELAINRLRSLFMFDEEAMSQEEYIAETKKLKEDIVQATERLAQLKAGNEEQLLTDSNFLEKASYYIMVEQFLNNKAGNINFEKYIRAIDPTIPRAFLRSVIKSITITDGQVDAIEFLNEVTVHFLRK